MKSRDHNTKREKLGIDVCQGKITRGVHLALYSGTILELAELFLERALIGWLAIGLMSTLYGHTDSENGLKMDCVLSLCVLFGGRIIKENDL